MRDSLLTRDQVLRALLILQHKQPHGFIRNGDLAGHLGVAGSSICARIQSLAQSKLVRCVPRRGAILTESGMRCAQASDAKQRLLEQFLLQVLHLKPKYVPIEAERMSRFVSERVMKGVSERLGVVPQVERGQ